MSSYSDYLKMQHYTANPAVDPAMFTQTGSFMPSNNNSMMDWGNSNAGSELRIGELAQAPITNAAFTGAGSATPQGFWGGINDWAKDSGFVGSKDAATGMMTGGWGAPAMQGISSLVNGFMGMKQYGLSKKIFENNKQQFERNFDAQKGVTNSQLSDRQDRRNADARANGMTGTTSTADYMAKWGVK